MPHGYKQICWHRLYCNTKSQETDTLIWLGNLQQIWSRHVDLSISSIITIPICLVMSDPRSATTYFWCSSVLFYSKSFRMPKYNTLHDVFPYLYLFWRNFITQSPTLNASSKLNSGYNWKSFYQLRSFISGSKLPDSTVKVSYSHRLRLMRLEEVGFFRMYQARAMKIPHSWSQNRWSWIRPGRIIYFGYSVHVSDLYLFYTLE